MDKNYVLNLINNGLTDKTAEEIDDYFSKNPSNLLSNYTAEEIAKILDGVFYLIGYSFAVLEVCKEINDFKLDILSTALSDENLLISQKYFKLKSLSNSLKNFNSFNFLGISLGSHYYYEGNNNLALYYYEYEFIAGDFNYNEYEFFDKFLNYVKLKVKLEGKIVGEETLRAFINKGIEKRADSLDFVYAINYYLNNFSYNKTYFNYVHKTIKSTVSCMQNDNTYGRDSDEERALLETLFIKFGQLIKTGTFKDCLDIISEIYTEIGNSNSTRYYHALTKYFYDALIEFLPKRPEFKFFTDFVSYGDLYFDKFYFKRPPILTKITNSTFTLINEKGLEFNFICTYYNSKYNSITIKPLFDEGEGISLFLNVKTADDGSYYLVK